MNSSQDFQRGVSASRHVDCVQLRLLIVFVPADKDAKTD